MLILDREIIFMGRVLLGICVGLNRDKSFLFRVWILGVLLRVDNLFIVIIVYSFGRSVLYKVNGDILDLFGLFGLWSLKIECFVLYFLINIVFKVIDVELLGDVDGFFLGYGIF